VFGATFVNIFLNTEPFDFFLPFLTINFDPINFDNGITISVHLFALLLWTLWPQWRWWPMCDTHTHTRPSYIWVSAM